MAQMKEYRVLRRLDGDRLYEAGNKREMTAADAQHLVDSGALKLIGDAKPAKPAKAQEPAK